MFVLINISIFVPDPTNNPMNRLGALFFAAFLLLSGCLSNETPPTAAPLPLPFEDIAGFHQLSLPPQDTFKVKADQGGTFTTKNGAVLQIPANAFELAGQLVQDTVQVFFRALSKRSDLILANAPAPDRINLWESGGLIHVDAKLGKNNLELKNATISIQWTLASKYSGKIPLDANYAPTMQSNGEIGPWERFSDWTYTGSQQVLFNANKLGWYGLFGVIAPINGVANFDLTTFGYGSEWTDGTAFVFLQDYNAVAVMRKGNGIAKFRSEILPVNEKVGVYPIGMGNRRMWINNYSYQISKDSSASLQLLGYSYKDAVSKIRESD